MPIATLWLGVAVVCLGDVVVDDPRTNEAAAAAVARFQPLEHRRPEVTDRQPLLVAYSTETVMRFNDRPRTRSAYDEHADYEYEPRRHGSGGRFAPETSDRSYDARVSEEPDNEAADRPRVDPEFTGPESKLLPDSPAPRHQQALDDQVESEGVKPVRALPLVTQHNLQDTKRRIMLNAIRIELTETRVIPDVLPEKFMPEFNITMAFNNQTVEMGQMLTVNETKSEPVIEFDSQPGQIYTVAMVDPDSPSLNRHGYRSYRHFLVSNLEAAENSTSNVITTYQSPQPEFGTGAHRYAIVVLKQQGHFNVTEDDVPPSRVRFDVVDWGRRRKMKPVAASYFMVKRNHVNEED
ncbi:Phosphatidylethanolamine-binding protein 1 [Coemansia thaxteri]|uniref:Phosphatidylethanolamine-binding protein 1 n=1 Tax=Coemansia thaxteri TaxID=2663907 RepID=A0A9W8BGL5_9FUNG|nr:Phosphatidylethanolamine-binding protein 1 [Coemansia thaxteri]